MDDNQELRVTGKFMIAIFSLLSVVLLMVLLHIYSKYLLRRQERRRVTALTRLISRQFALDIQGINNNYSTEPPKAGLDPVAIASLPMLPFKPNDHHENECLVCLGTLVEDAMVRVLPNCKHMFHVECIDMWLGSNTACPLCRTGAEPVRLQQQEASEVQPSAPPLVEENNMRCGSDRTEKGAGGSSSGSLFGSFRWMVTRDRSPRARTSREEVDGQDLERQ